MYRLHVLSQRDEKVIQYLLCHHWEADILMCACAALGACLIYGLHGLFYFHNLIPPSSALSAPLEQEIFSPRTTRSHIQRRRRRRRRYLVNISLQIHGQIPLFEWRSQKRSRGQTIAHFTLISWGVQTRRSLPPHPTSRRPSPPTWSEHWYRATELQMPPIRLGDRSEVLSGPLHDITVAGSWWKDEMFLRVAQCH